MTTNKIKISTQNIKKIFITSLLVLTLTLSAFAGNYINNQISNEGIEKIAFADETVRDGYGCGDFGSGGYGEGCVQPTGGSSETTDSNTGSNESTGDGGNSTTTDNSTTTNNDTNTGNTDSNTGSNESTGDGGNSTTTNNTSEAPLITSTPRTGGMATSLVLGGFGIFFVVIFSFIKNNKLSFKNVYNQRIKEE